MTARIDPAVRPYSEAVQKTLDRVMPPGVPPLVLFTTLARSERAFARFMAAGLIDKGPISLKEREIMIDRTCARSGSEYEWGVHVVFFAERAGLTKAQITGTTARQIDPQLWTERERLIVRLADELHDTATIGEDLWRGVSAAFTVEQILELILLAGFYRTVAYLTNGLRLPLESFGARLPEGARDMKRPGSLAHPASEFPASAAALEQTDHDRSQKCEHYPGSDKAELFGHSASPFPSG